MGSGNSMRLSTSCRAICENSSVVSVQYAVEKCFGGSLVNVSLGRILVKDGVEAKGLVFDSPALRKDCPGKLLDWIVFRRIEYSITSQ